MLREANILSTIIFMHKFNLNKDYFKERADKIFSITKNEIIYAVEEVTLNKSILFLYFLSLFVLISFCFFKII
jgi:hypothetical protein